MNNEDSQKYNQSNTQNTNESNDRSSDSQSNNFFYGDIPGGFQTLNPEVFNIIGQILADVVAGRIPFNVQNALGNWIQLIGQAIETYSAQQNYFQSGPGRFYNLKYYNVDNPFIPINEQEANNSESSTNFNNVTSESQLNEIINIIDELKKDVRCINTRIDNLANTNNNHNL
ncbi:MAG TPA: hypothetical protein DG753_08575 [Clostridium sp.]|nr:hypothetical protein [Clostridium sp.]